MFSSLRYLRNVTRTNVEKTDEKELILFFFFSFLLETVARIAFREKESIVLLRNVLTDFVIDTRAMIASRRFFDLSLYKVRINYV